MKSFNIVIINFVTVLLMVGLTLVPPVFAAEPAGYFFVTAPCNLKFPKDHGSHHGYRTEWWYYTGNLRSESGDRYGFQLTFFRSQISPPGADKEWPQPPSAWRTQQIYLAHSAISDISRKQHLQAERVSREALKMAGASQTEDTTAVFLHDWSARIGLEKHLLKVNTDGFSYELKLTPLKPPVLHGRDGYSLKGSTPERASCYYSYTRIKAEGRLSIGENSFAVKGFAWMDHEFSTAPLEYNLKGWDWFSLQFSDQTEFMAFILRKAEGGISAASGGTFIGRHGQNSHLSKDEFTVTVMDTWKSPYSKAVYPARWRLQVFPQSLDLTIVPNLADQEMRTSESTGVIYWEGSVSIKGTKAGKPIEGQGYTELTGYAKPFDAPM